MKPIFKIELGSKVRCKITGFTGIVGGRYEYLWGCVQYGVRSQKLDKDGQPGQLQQFDEDQLEVIAKPPAKLTRRDTGGPQPRNLGHVR